jgi:aminoglycoside 6'-N-acetyltransferase I
VLVVERPLGGLCGFAEVAVRSVADGCRTAPVAYLEGWYVDADVRRRGCGAALIAAVVQWSRARGMCELGSDTELQNLASQRAHLHTGFTEVGRVVQFRKDLNP